MVHAKDGDYMEVELFGKPALFSNYRIDSVSVPKGLCCYDLRGSDDDPGMPIAVEPLVVVNHAGTVLTVEPIECNNKLYRREFDEDNGLNFTGGHIELKDFCEKHGIAYSETKYALRPASQDEAGLFYAMPPEKDAELGCIGHIRIDFGHGGKEFWHTWHPRGPEELSSPVFKAELQEVVDEMRQTVLSDMVGMKRFCTDNGGYMDGGWAPNYGYIAETEQYRYCLRCIPVQGDYNAYLTCYDKQVQEMNQAEQPEQGMQMGGM